MSDGWLNYIRHWRQAAGLSQEELGARLDPPASKGMISQYESGERKPRQVRLASIAKALDTTPGALLDGPPKPTVPAQIIDIWSRIPLEQHGHAMAVLETFATKSSRR